MLRDEKNKKFSKSSGNNIEPLEVAEKYGTDALRLSLISGITPGQDSKFYYEKVEGARNFVTKLWNIILYANNSDQEFKLEEDLNAEDIKSVADSWICNNLEKIIQDVSNDFEIHNNNFNYDNDSLDKKFRYKIDIIDSGWLYYITKELDKNDKNKLYFINHISN